MIYGLGPRAQRVYVDLRERILSGELPAGSKLTPHLELAASFGVAPLTVRQVLARLEEEGLVSRQQGRGTFVRNAVLPGVLIVDDDTSMVALFRVHVTRAGYRAVPASGPEEAQEQLEQDDSIGLVLTDVRMPGKEEGVQFIRTVTRRWPRIPIAVVTGYPNDLEELHGTPECPVLVLPKPVWAHQIELVLHLALRNAPHRAGVDATPAR